MTGVREGDDIDDALISVYIINMPAKSFPFERARRVTPGERRVFRKAYENTFGEKPPRRGRPPKGPEKYRDIHIKLHPKALQWARLKAKKHGIGYQTVINDLLLREAAARPYRAGRSSI